MSQPFVAVLMGSNSDLSTMESCFEVLKSLEIPFEAHIYSAHRTPDLTAAYVKDAESRGCQVFIAAAGLAAHLAGAIAANTSNPVIGVPMEVGGMHGWDALLSTVQMPGGTPVACTAIGKAGAKNAGYLAGQILALNNSELKNRIDGHRQAKRDELQSADAKLQQRFTKVTS